jgi:ubiquinone/menaquinone biosynthesis C-methylase UbiE
MELTDILMCPRSGSGLQFDADDSVVRVDGSDAVYPVIDGIIDFGPARPDKVSAAYDRAAHHYDAHLTGTAMIARICNRIFWGGEDEASYHNATLSCLPAEFDGVFLDVPVGTGVFTGSPYARYPNATIIGVDSSMGMLRKAKNRFDAEGLTNVRLIRADAAHLPVREGVVDLLLSMNSLHVFTEKRQAIAEMRRVLREKGKLIASGYVEGDSRWTDWFVRHIAARRGYFNRPFFRREDLAEEFAGFAITRQRDLRSFVCVEAVKEGAGE